MSQGFRNTMNTSEPSSAPSPLASLLARTRAVLAAAEDEDIDIRDAVRIADADPSDAESLADSISHRAHVPLIVAAHPGCHLRADGAVVPMGETWEMLAEGADYSADADGGPDASPREVLAGIDVDSWGADTSEGPVTWHVEVRLAVVLPSGYAGHIQGSACLEAQQDELYCEVECGRDGHEWASDHDVVGGLKENPGVWGHGGGVTTRRHCRHCGTYRVTDTWADDGRGGHTTRTHYEEPDDASLRYVALRLLEGAKWRYEASTSLDGERAASCSLVSADGDELACAYATPGELDTTSDECGVSSLRLAADDIDWPDPDDAIAEAWGPDEGADTSMEAQS
jgi:hypothetical protein